MEWWGYLIIALVVLGLLGVGLWLLLISKTLVPTPTTTATYTTLKPEVYCAPKSNDFLMLKNTSLSNCQTTCNNKSSCIAVDYMDSSKGDGTDGMCMVISGSTVNLFPWEPNPDKPEYINNKCYILPKYATSDILNYSPPPCIKSGEKFEQGINVCCARKGAMNGICN